MPSPSDYRECGSGAAAIVEGAWLADKIATKSNQEAPGR